MLVVHLVVQQAVVTSIGSLLPTHNQTVGAAILKGKLGGAFWNIRLAQRLSGVNPDSPEGAMVLMGVAKRFGETGSV